MCSDPVLCNAASVKQTRDFDATRSCLALAASEFLPALSLGCINEEIPKGLVNHAQLELRSRRLKLAFKSQEIVSSVATLCVRGIQRLQTAGQPTAECGAWKK